MLELAIGKRVRVKSRTHDYFGKIGVITDSFWVQPGVGPKRLKWAVTYPHSRTKSHTVTLAMEADDFEVQEN